MNQLKPPIRIAVLAASLLVISQAKAQSLTAIDPSAGPASGINDSGTVVLGSYYWSNGTLTSLGTGVFMGTGGPLGTYPMTEASAINENGEIVGIIGYHAAFRNAAGTITDLGTLEPGSANYVGSTAKAVNNAAVAAGFGSSHGQTYSWYGSVGSQPTLVSAPPGTRVASTTISAAYGINTAGLMTGYFNRDNGVSEFHFAYVYNTVNTQWTELGQGVGFAISDSGRVTGVIAFPGYAACGQAFTSQPSVSGTQSIGTLGGDCSTGYAINDLGYIGGSSELTVGNTTRHAFFFNGAMQDLNDMVPANDPMKATVTLTEVRGITSGNLVVVNGFDSSSPSVTRAYLLQAPKVTFQGGQLDFGTVEVGTTSGAQSVVLKNNGAAAVSLGAVSVQDDFSQTNNCPASLAPAATCTFSVKFSPITGGNHAGHVTVLVDGIPQRAQARGSATIRATLTSSTTSLTASVPFTLTWQATAGSTCIGIGNNIPGTQAGVTWAQSKPASGSGDYIPNVAGTYYFSVRCTANGQTVDSNTLELPGVWPDIPVLLTPSVTALNSGGTFAMTWSAAYADSCTASGGGANDNWPGPRPTVGSVNLFESSAVSAPTPLTFTLTCTSSASGKSGSAQALVTLNPAPPPAPPPPQDSGGGGSMDGGLLAGLGLALGISLRRRRTSTLHTSAG